MILSQRSEVGALGVCFPTGSDGEDCAMPETCNARSLGWEDSREKGMTKHFRILPRGISWAEEPGRLQPMGSQRVGRD